MQQIWLDETSEATTYISGHVAIMLQPLVSQQSVTFLNTIIYPSDIIVSLYDAQPLLCINHELHWRELLPVSPNSYNNVIKYGGGGG